MVYVGMLFIYNILTEKNKVAQVSPHLRALRSVSGYQIQVFDLVS